MKLPGLLAVARQHLRIYLTDSEFRQRVLMSKAWSEYLKSPPIPPFDETAALNETEQKPLEPVAKKKAA